MSIERKVVAVVDDDPDMLKGRPRLLQVYKFEPHVFSSAEAFLDSTAANETTCLIVDIQLGGISGIELRRRLTASGLTLPVIFITATDDESTRKEALKTGCIAYLQKPFPARLLIDAIGKAGD